MPLEATITVNVQLPLRTRAKLFLLKACVACVNLLVASIESDKKLFKAK